MSAIGLVLFSGFGILCAAWVVAALAGGEYPTAVVGLGFAAFCFGMVAAYIKVRLGSVTARVAFDATGTTIRPDRDAVILSGMSLIGLEVAMGLGAILAFLGRLDIPLAPGQRLDRLVGIGAVGALFGLPTLWRMFTQGTYLRLNPSGFEFSQGWPAAVGDWIEVKDVTNQAPGRRAAAPSAIVMVMSDGHTPTLIAGSFTPDGRVLRALVRFYWRHPEHRNELTDGRALERFNDRNFE